MATLNLQVIFDAKDKITGPMKAIIGGSKHVTNAFKETNSELKKLKDQQNVINRFRELQTSVDKTSQSLDRHKQIVNDLKARARLGPLTAEQTRALNNAEQAVKRLNNTYHNQSQELTSVVQSINRAGMSVSNLASDENNLRDRIHNTTMELNRRREAMERTARAQAQYARTQERLRVASDFAKKSLMVSGAAAATMVVPVKLAIDYESSMADVKKVFNGTDAQFRSLNSEILQMSQRLPMAAKDIAAIVAAGGQSGIATNELTKFTETAVKMGVAFDISAQESGQAMAELRTAFKLSQDQVTTLADQINYLGNNTPAAAKGIMEIVQRIGPLGEVGGYTSASIAALGATLRGMGIQEEIAATGIKNMMLALVAGESATKSQNAAYKELGLDSKKIAKQMQKDANGTMLEVLKAVAKLDKYKQAAVLGTLFGKESLGSIAPLLTNMGALEKNLGMVADKTKYAGSMNAEYAARAATTANNIQLFKNKVAALAIHIGSILLPPLNQLLGFMGTLVTKVTAWAQHNPALASSITKIAVGVIAVTGGLSILALGIVTIFGPLAMLRMTLTTLGFSFGALGAIFSPVGLIILGVVAAIAGAAYLIYKNWGTITGFFSNIWSQVKTAFNGGITGVSALILNWSPIGLFYSAFAKVLSWFGTDLPSKFTGFGAMIIEGLKNGILSKIQSVEAAISSAAERVIVKAKVVLGIHSPSRVFAGLGGYTMQGLALGISNNQNLAHQATAQAATGVTSSFKPKFSDSSAPKFNRAATLSNPRNATFVNSDNITIHINGSNGGPLKNAANEVRQALAQRDRERMAAQRRMMHDKD